MSATPEHEKDPLRTRIQALSALEKAMREALAAAPIEQVVQQVTVMFPRTPVEIDTSRFHSRVQKVSVSMPEELTAAVRARTGPGGFSRYVTEAVQDVQDHLTLVRQDLVVGEVPLPGVAPPDPQRDRRAHWLCPSACAGSSSVV